MKRVKKDKNTFKTNDHDLSKGKEVLYCKSVYKGLEKSKSRTEKEPERFLMKCIRNWDA